MIEFIGRVMMAMGLSYVAALVVNWINFQINLRPIKETNEGPRLYITKEL